MFAQNDLTKSALAQGLFLLVFVNNVLLIKVLALADVDHFVLLQVPEILIEELDPVVLERPHAYLPK